MSRLNNDVIGAQQAVTGTLVTFASNVFTVIATLVIMMAMEWRLTLVALAHFAGVYRAGAAGRPIAARYPPRIDGAYSAELNAAMNETLNVSGALLVKLFGQEQRELDRFQWPCP